MKAKKQGVSLAFYDIGGKLGVWSCGVWRVELGVGEWGVSEREVG